MRDHAPSGEDLLASAVDLGDDRRAHRPLPPPMLTLLSLAAVLAAAVPHEEATPPRAHWIFLADRADTGPVAAQDVDVTPRALARRAVRGDARRPIVGIEDLPVDAAHIAALRAMGAEPRVMSRWLNAVSVVASPETLHRLASLPCVRGIQPVRSAPSPEVAVFAAPAPNGGGVAGGLEYGASGEQLAQIDLPALHERGFTGAGVVIGILDTGFNLVHEAFNQPDHALEVIAAYDFINDDPDVGIEPDDPPSQHRHGTWILGTIGAWLPGTLIGAAPDAAFILAKTEDVSSETPVEEDYYVAGLEFIEAQGGDVATSSLSYFDWYDAEDFDGQTAVTTIAVNMATAKGLVCLTAAGNGGHDEDPATAALGAPADAFDVLTCGAIELSGEIAGFSSDGPTFDGRVKPELLALGVGVATVHSTDETGLSAINGTSLSTPLVAGAVACILEARPALDVTALRSALLVTATDSVAGVAPDPLFVRGYGAVQANAASLFGLPEVDLDGDGDTDGADLGILLAQWGPCPTSCTGDLDGNGAVDGSDLGVLLAAWE